MRPERESTYGSADTEVQSEQSMDQCKIAAYQKAVEKLQAAVHELMANPPDWEAAHERVREAAEHCESARLALDDPE